MASADQAALSALAGMKGVAGELSPLGAVALKLANSAVEIASGGLTPAKAAELGAELAANVVSAIEPTLQQIVTDLADDASAAGLTSVAEALPVIAQVFQFAFSMADMAQAQAAAEEAAHQQLCTTMFVPVPTAPWGSGSGGEVVAANIFRGAEHGPRARYAPSLAKLLRVYEVDEYVPKSVRQQLRRLREAMHGPPNGPLAYDGGASLWPLYVDLIHSQWKQGRGSAKNTVDYYLKTDEIIAGLCEDSPNLRSALEQSLGGLLWSWDTRVNPILGVDRASLDSVLAHATGPSIALRPIAQHGARALLGVKMPKPQKPPALARIARSAKAIESAHGVTFLAAPSAVGPAMVRTLPPRDHPSYDEMVRMVVEAARGELGPHASAQAAVSAAATTQANEDAEAIAIARDLVLQAEAGDVCAQATIDEITDAAEAGDDVAIESFGAVKAALEGLDDGSLPDATDDELAAFAEGCIGTCSCERRTDEPSPATYETEPGDPVQPDEMAVMRQLGLGVGGPRDVIIWKGGSHVPSGIAQSKETAAIRKGFDPQPDPPGFQMRGGVPGVDPNAGGFIIYGKQGQVSGDYAYGFAEVDGGLGYAEGSPTGLYDGFDSIYPYDGSTYGWEDADAAYRVAFFGRDE